MASIRDATWPPEMVEALLEAAALWLTSATPDELCSSDPFLALAGEALDLQRLLARGLPPAPSRPEIEEQPIGAHVVYRAFALGGDLLYVGVSSSLARRLGVHRASSRWWRACALIRSERHPTRAMAELAEQEAIRAERPTYNVHGRR